MKLSCLHAWHKGSMIPSDSNEADGPATSTSAEGDRDPRATEGEEDSESESPAIVEIRWVELVRLQRTNSFFFLVGREKIAEGTGTGGRLVQAGQNSSTSEFRMYSKAAKGSKRKCTGQKPIASSQSRQKQSQLPNVCH